MKHKRPQTNLGSKYITKWLSILAILLMIGGTFAFGFIAFFANLFNGTQDYYDPIWMIAMLPLMALIATPISLFINKQIRKHMDILSEKMNAVANGNTNVYIPTADANAFCGLYEDFNKMVAEIQSIQVIRTDLVDSFSHELKTPIASINGFANLLLEEDLSEEKRKKYLQIIIKETERLSLLAKNSLLMSKIDSQEIISDKKPYNLAKQIQDCAISLETEWNAKNIDITAELEEVIYEGNANLMDSVWINLLSNAIKFTPNNGEIKIKMKISQENIHVSISDTGIGMSQEVLANIFHKYYQGDKSHSSNGHGLGLSIVKRIIQLCNGSIEVQSTQGEGSTFCVILPRTNS